MRWARPACNSAPAPPRWSSSCIPKWGTAGEGLPRALSAPRPACSGQLPLQVLDLPLLSLVLASQAIDLALLAGVLLLQLVGVTLAPRQLLAKPLHLVAQASYPVVAGQPVIIEYTRLMPYFAKSTIQTLDLVWPPGRVERRRRGYRPWVGPAASFRATPQSHRPYPVSCERSSNRASRFPAHGSRTGFTPRHATGPHDAPRPGGTGHHVRRPVPP